MLERIIGTVLIIYRVVNKINDKCYIGQTISTLKKRKQQHISAAFHSENPVCFHNALKTYGRENFEWFILGECDNLEDLNELEKFYMDFYDSLETGYNVLAGKSSRKIGNDEFVGYKLMVSTEIDNATTKYMSDYGIIDRNEAVMNLITMGLYYHYYYINNVDNSNNYLYKSKKDIALLHKFWNGVEDLNKRLNLFMNVPVARANFFRNIKEEI